MAAASAQPVLRSRRARPLLWLGLPLCFGMLGLALLSSIAFGAADIDALTVWCALTAFDGSTGYLIIRTLRVPRAVIGALVGAALAVAGAIIQGLTRNPMADPGLLGINTGSALAVVAAVFFLRTSSPMLYAWFAFAGAGLTALVSTTT